MNGLAFATLLALAAGLPPAAFPARAEPSMANSEEQALFAGFYAQGYAHGNGSPVSVSSLPSSGFARFDLGTRALSALPDPMTPGYALENGLCSPDFPGYAFDDSPSSMYFDGQAQKPFEDAGPKSERLSPLCKVRAYYYDVPTPFGLAAVMYDQTGFLVGDSLLMTAAHGLCLDATSGMFDDGIENLHFPGKVEVYGAIGLADGWGSGYRYYSTCAEMYLDAGFPAGRLINADWALLRLDSPLGRELSHRALYPECGPFDELSLSGYPGWGQKPATVSAEDGSILSSYGQLAYGADAEPGMSGAPLFDGRLHLDSVRQARGYDSAQRPILAARFAYGMHLRHDAEQGLGFGLRFTNSLCDFVSALNRRYRPDEIDALAAIEGADAGGLFALGPDHAAEIALINSSAQSGTILLSPGASAAEATLTFDFPVAGIDWERSQADSGSLALETESYGPQAMLGSAGSLDFQTPVFSFSIRAEGSPVSLTSLTVRPDWAYIPWDYAAPYYYDDEVSVGSDNNCVSYALRYVVSGYESKPETGIVPHKPDGASLTKPFDYAPGAVARLLRDELLGEYDLAMDPIGKYEPCAHGGYKIALVCDPFHYYHVLRQNRTGMWSHFLMGSGVTKFDVRGQTILDPEEAVFANFPAEAPNSGSPEVEFDAASFVGFFEVYAT